MSSEKRLIVVSNRIPVTLKKDGGNWSAAASSGGLATAMDPILKESGGLWVGWSGETVELDPALRDRLISEASHEIKHVPVDIPPAAAQAFYEGFPNQTLWPLFHYFPSLMQFEPASWQTYQEGNALFAATVTRLMEPDDLVWIHDYHLMLLPSILRCEKPRSRIGFFLHIPFPSSEVFSMLPHREKILEGLLGADLIAVHTHRHLHHLRSSFLRILGLESTINSVEYQGRTIRLEALPIGIAPTEFSELLQSNPVTAHYIEEMRSRHKDECIVVAVDRLDYTKGIPDRLEAFRRLLTEHPEKREKIVLIQVAVPSREGIESYQNLRSEINELVGDINGSFGTPQWTPIVYIHRSVPKPELAALYRAAAIALVTPLRDGMNLVAKEFCACHPEGDAVLILSEFAGAAAEMGEALLVNPYDREQVAAALVRAIDMDADERRRRMCTLHARVLRNDVYSWAERFVSALTEASEQGAQRDSKPLDVPALTERFRSASRRLLILDYDGTLVDIVDDPRSAVPPPSLLETLRSLTSDARNCVAIVSGRTTKDLERFLTGVPALVLIAEHGALVRNTHSGEWQSRTPGRDIPVWKKEVRNILDHFVDRAPGSFIEEKEFIITWHFRGVEPEFGKWLASELHAMLEGLLADTEARPILGKKIVEIRPVWANKGDAVNWLLNSYPNPDFILALGDDATDEDMFSQLDKSTATVHVGSGNTKAQFSLPSPASVRRLLSELA